MNLQEILKSYFKELNPDIKEIVSEVYELEKNSMDYYDGRQQITPRIKEVIDRVARLSIEQEARYK